MAASAYYTMDGGRVSGPGSLQGTPGGGGGIKQESGGSRIVTRSGLCFQLSLCVCVIQPCSSWFQLYSRVFMPQAKCLSVPRAVPSVCPGVHVAPLSSQASTPSLMWQLHLYSCFAYGSLPVWVSL